MGLKSKPWLKLLAGGIADAVFKRSRPSHRFLQKMSLYTPGHLSKTWEMGSFREEPHRFLGNDAICKFSVGHQSNFNTFRLEFRDLILKGSRPKSLTSTNNRVGNIMQ